MIQIGEMIGEILTGMANENNAMMHSDLFFFKCLIFDILAPQASENRENARLENHGDISSTVKNRGHSEHAESINNYGTHYTPVLWDVRIL